MQRIRLWDVIVVSTALLVACAPAVSPAVVLEEAPMPAAGTPIADAVKGV